MHTQQVNKKEKEFETNVQVRNVSLIGETEIALVNDRARKPPRSHQVESLDLL